MWASDKMYHMSLILAIANRKDIVIGCESKFGLTQDGKPHSTTDELKKVRRINKKLALMVTGEYASDKLQFFKDYVSAAKNITNLHKAAALLDNMVEKTLPLNQEMASV
jgi:hypothetical protein